MRSRAGALTFSKNQCVRDGEESTESSKSVLVIPIFHEVSRFITESQKSGNGVLLPSVPTPTTSPLLPFPVRVAFQRLSGRIRLSLFFIKPQFLFVFQLKFVPSVTLSVSGVPCPAPHGVIPT